ncbi:MAG: hypothetical protein LBF88_04255 [Planctomycetaceae bacterium]|nr:hypothetical protein [Planctomycetaceae bacterium]
MNRFFNSIILLSVFLIGCDLAKPQGRKEEPMNTPVKELVNNPEAETNPDNENSPAETENETKNSDNGENKSKEPETELVKADVGAGKKGHYGQTGGEQVSDIITVPIATMFRAKEMIAYRNQVPHALQIYKAMHENKGPETHEEFMKDVIQANNIPLPQLPEGQEYIYDPATEQLMIKKPK